MTLMAYEHGTRMFRPLACSLNVQIHPVHGIRCTERPRILHHHGNIA
jgi:hypothetical protein